MSDLHGGLHLGLDVLARQSTGFAFPEWNGARLWTWILKAPEQLTQRSGDFLEGHVCLFLCSRSSKELSGKLVAIKGATCSRVQPLRCSNASLQIGVINQQLTSPQRAQVLPIIRQWATD